MRLIRRAVGPGERLTVAVDDGWVDVVDLDPSFPVTMADLLASETAGLEAIGAASREPERIRSVVRHAIEPGPALAPVARPGKIVAVGRNYAEHAAEEGVATPADPVVFTKFTNAIVGDGAEIRWRASDTAQVDFEAELGVVIGRRARDVTLGRALDHVLGYVCLNDVSARDLQFADGQWVRGKSLDTFCPIGPWLVTADEVPDPQALAIRCLVNGEVMQDASTGAMIHGVGALIEFIARYITLEPGDLIATGTPAGVGVFRDPPRFLADGDEVVIDIAGIGSLRNTCRIVPG